jgi:hypothetical protein
MTRSYLRLRQIALVARALEPVERQLTSVLATEVCFRDPGVEKYGLHNALWALGGTFLEVVVPVRDNTCERDHHRGRRVVAHQGSGPSSLKNPPVGPSGGRVASRTGARAACSTVRGPRWPLRSVAV